MSRDGERPAASAAVLRCAAVLAAAVLLVPIPAAAGPAQPAAIGVKGLGWLGDRAMRRTLLLLMGNERGAVLGAPAIEDAALLVYSALAQEGYLRPALRVSVRRGASRPATYALDPDLARPLPRSLEAAEVVFRIRRGRRYTVFKVEFDGLAALRADRAAGYFRGEGALAALTAGDAYSPERLRRSSANLLLELRRLGYAEAEVNASAVRIDRRTGRVWIRVAVRQGPLWRVTAVEVRVAGGGPAPPGLAAGRIGRPWSPAWQHDAEAALRRWYYASGHPDAKVEVAPRAGPPSEGVRAVTAVAEVTPGAFVRLGRIVFVGDRRTRASVLRPLVRARPGGPLDPLQLQDGQLRLSRLGVFSSVELGYQPATGPVRDAVYTLQEGKKQDLDTLLGWGSFEELRGGVEWRDYDLFGLAHQGSLELVQSMKSTEGEYDYTVPEIFGTEADGTAKLFGFSRRERAFVDEEYGANLSVSRPVEVLGASLVAGYTFERLAASDDTLATELTDLTHAAATSVALGLARDRRDNPLDPRRGYKLYANATEASRLLGGQVDFQQFELGASYHHPLGEGRWLHAGLSHAVITTFGAPAGNVLPPNVLFYPGGEDSIRGYGEGQAAARDAAGRYLGVKTFTLLNLELEQALTAKLSAVAFADALGASATLARYPFDYRLYSAGLGLRYRTIVGPVRIEYGRNLNRRPYDPVGTLQFSVGYPF